MADNYLSEQEQAHQWYINQAIAMGQATGTSALQAQAIGQAQAQPPSLDMFRGFLGRFGQGFGIGGSMSQPGMSHFGMVKEFRKKFKEYTKAEFREMGSRPVIKEILSGMTKLNKEQIQERITEHLAAV